MRLDHLFIHPIFTKKPTGISKKVFPLSFKSTHIIRYSTSTVVVIGIDISMRFHRLPSTWTPIVIDFFCTLFIEFFCFCLNSYRLIEF